MLNNTDIHKIMDKKLFVSKYIKGLSHKNLHRMVTNFQYIVKLFSKVPI